MTLISFGPGLRHGVGSIQKEDRYFLVGGSAYVHRAMPAFCWRVPVRLTHANLKSFRFSPITVLDRKCFATHDHGHTMKRIDMPRLWPRRAPEPSA
jgi:hypothetical protein